LVKQKMDLLIQQQYSTGIQRSLSDHVLPYLHQGWWSEKCM
jgi:hypothetical protein